jgi:hypothetical protein
MAQFNNDDAYSVIEEEDALSESSFAQSASRPRQLPDLSQSAEKNCKSFETVVESVREQVKDFEFEAYLPAEFIISGTETEYDLSHSHVVKVTKRCLLKQFFA